MFKWKSGATLMVTDFGHFQGGQRYPLDGSEIAHILEPEGTGEGTFLGF